MKLLTPEEEEAHYNAVKKAGLVAGVAGLIGGLAGVRAASILFPKFRALTVPFKGYIVTSVGTFCAVVAAEDTSARFEVQRKYRRMVQGERI